MYALILPFIVALRYDRMVAVAVITVAPFVGRMGSTINPFVIGIGSDVADISIGDGIVLRAMRFILVTTAMILYLLWCARTVRADPDRSLAGIHDADRALAKADAAPPAFLTGSEKSIIWLVVFTFALLTFSIVPWGAILGNAQVDYYTHETINSPFAWELGWWMPELTALFFVMAIVVGIAGRLGEGATARAFIKGVIEFTGPALWSSPAAFPW